MDESSKERRKHLRIYRHFIISYHEKGKSTLRHHVSQVNDVSRGGVKFSSTHPLKEGVVLLMDLKTPFVADSIHLEGIVLESREKVPELIYENRLQFQNISDKAFILLEKLESYCRLKET